MRSTPKILVESLDFTTGVRETVGCGVCGTNSVQLNGMEGGVQLGADRRSALVGRIGLRLRVGRDSTQHDSAS